MKLCISPVGGIGLESFTADTFYRTGAVEIWGRGTNRVIEECVRYGVSP